MIYCEASPDVAGVLAAVFVVCRRGIDSLRAVEVSLLSCTLLWWSASARDV